MNGTARVTVIQPSRGWVALGFKELWEFREVLYFLTWRDLAVRYKQTILGVAWAVLQPVLAMVIFSILFGRLAKVPSDGIPYPVFAYCGLVPWQFFAHAVTESGRSLVTNRNLVTKVYFPRLAIPLAAGLSGLVDFGIAFVVLLGLMAWYGIVPTEAIWMLPGFVALAVGAAFAVGLWLAALNAQYRDIRYTIPFLTQVWLFLTPVVYPASLVPERWHVLYGLNPMAGVVEGFRWALLGKAEAPGPLIMISAAVTVIALVGGLYYFRRMERTFADVV